MEIISVAKSMGQAAYDLGHATAMCEVLTLLSNHVKSGRLDQMTLVVLVAEVSQINEAQKARSQAAMAGA